MTEPILPSTRKVLEQLQEQYNAVLDREFSQLANNYAELLQLGKISGENRDKHVVAREVAEAQVHATNILRAAQNLLALIADLKQRRLVQDLERTQTIQQMHASKLLLEQSHRRQQLEALRESLGKE